MDRRYPSASNAAPGRSPTNAPATHGRPAVTARLRPAELAWFTERLEQDLAAAFDGWFRGTELRRHPQAGYDLVALADALQQAHRPADAHLVAAELAAITGAALPPDFAAPDATP